MSRAIRRRDLLRRVAKSGPSAAAPGWLATPGWGAEKPNSPSEWIAACKTGSPTTCNFDYACALTETVLLGAVACRAGKTLEWDPSALKATNSPEAEEYIRYRYRSGGSL